ncbi:hypothetical protein EYZ11_008503 [Aspergillus tanneri]|uniref:Uncharacterized protein n=1 Tax=Aspergillus tanneri TaxID=1220188 RepID=A0A4S3JAD2_9EURO|nr:hypothetical protein EYZ11_008503 [Aspergillus tanneri]
MYMPFNELLEELAGSVYVVY